VILPRSSKLSFLSTGLAVLSALTLSASAQLPAPLLYYPLDDAVDSTTATDSSGNGYTGQAHFVGLIDEVVVYQEVLSQEQITLLADGVNCLTTTIIEFDDN